MRYCKKCTMPDTRPGITFDSEGVCSACRYANRKNVGLDARFKELQLPQQVSWHERPAVMTALLLFPAQDSYFQV